MKTISTLFLLTSISLCSACGSFLASVQSEPIEDDPGKRTYGAKVEDESIETKAKVNIAASHEELKNSHFSVTSYNGYVLIVGQVPSQERKQQVSEVVRKIRRVRRIYNELDVVGNSSRMTRSSDTWVTTKVKSALLADSSIEGGRIKVVTENGVVYLMGLVSHSEADRVSEATSSTAGVQKVVQLFEYIQERSETSASPT
jgi:osmotically-inducible protein OsmY